MSTPIKKILRDIFKNKTKTAIIILTLFIGNLAIGIVVMFSSYLIPEANKAYLSANPHEAFLLCDEFDSSIVNKVIQLPGVKNAAARKTLTVRFVLEHQTLNANLTALEGNNSIDTLRTSDGSNVLPILNKNELFLERAAKKAVGRQNGDSIRILNSDNKEYSLKLKATVYDAVSEPYTLEGDIVSFINKDTLKELTGDDRFNEVLLQVDGNNRDKNHITEVANNVSLFLEQNGISVSEIVVPEPGTFYATQALEAIKIIIAIIGGLSIFLGIALIINIFNSIMLQHMKQIGIMKSIGGRTNKITCMYISMVFFIGLFTFLLSIPVSTAIGYLVCKMLGSLLNMTLNVFYIPYLLIIYLFVSSIIVPIATALFPILKGTRSTIYDTLNNNVKAICYKNPSFIDFFTKRKTISSILLVSVRNNFRNRLRVILTISTLSLAGALMITGLNLQKSFGKEINEGKFLIPDGILTLKSFEDADKLEQIAGRIEGIEVAEAWGFIPGSFIENNTGNTKKVRIMAPKPASNLFDLRKAEDKLISGRLIKNDGSNEILVSNHLTSIYPDLKLGDTIKIIIHDKPVEFHIVGFISLFGRPSDPILITDYKFLNRLLAGENKVIDLRASTKKHSLAYQRKVFSLLEDELNKNGIMVSEINLGYNMLEEFTTTTSVTTLLLLFLAAMIGIVASIGLSGTLSLNILERSREFGIMRSLGGTHKLINSMIRREGIFLCMLSWIVSILLSLPLTFGIGNMIGPVLLGVPAHFQFSFIGLIFWFALSFVFSMIAGMLPCRHLNKMVTREVLSYE